MDPDGRLKEDTRRHTHGSDRCLMSNGAPSERIARLGTPAEFSRSLPPESQPALRPPKRGRDRSLFSLPSTCSPACTPRSQSAFRTSLSGSHARSWARLSSTPVKPLPWGRTLRFASRLRQLRRLTFTPSASARTRQGPRSTQERCAGPRELGVTRNRYWQMLRRSLVSG